MNSPTRLRCELLVPEPFGEQASYVSATAPASLPFGGLIAMLLGPSPGPTGGGVPLGWQEQRGRGRSGQVDASHPW